MSVNAEAASPPHRQGPPSVWVLTDGKIGDDVQCLAIAAALNPRFEKRVVAPRFPWSALAPWGPLDPREAPGREGGPLSGTPPAIAILSGRRAIPHANALKRVSNGHTKIIILKNPRVDPELADVLWAPAHDRLEGGNVISTLTSPHGLGPTITAGADPGAFIAQSPAPILGVVLGGATAGVGAGPDYSEEAATDLAKRISGAGADYARIAVTPSRRTPAPFLAAFKAALPHEKTIVWEGKGDNPYSDILANADAIVVAGDSHNMVSEALASRASVYIWKPKGLAPKMEWFVSNLLAHAHAREFIDGAPAYARTPIDATPEIVAQIKARLGL